MSDIYVLHQTIITNIKLVFKDISIKIVLKIAKCDKN